MSAPSQLAAPSLTGALDEREVDRRASQSLFWQIARVSVQLTQFVVLARLVPPDEFGKLALVFPVFALLMTLNDSGLSTATVTSGRYDARLGSNLWWTQAGLGLCSAAIMLLAAPVLAFLLRAPDLIGIGAGLAIGLVIESWGLQSRAQLRRTLRLAALGVVEISGAALGVAAAWIASHWIHGAAVLVIAYVAAAATRAAIAVRLAPVQVQRFTASTGYTEALRTGFNVASSDLLNALRVHCPLLIIGFFAALHEVGVFGRAAQLVNAPLLALGPAITNFLLPSLSRLRESPQNFSDCLRRAQRLFLAAAIPGSVWLAFGPTDAIVLALGAEWAPVAPLLQALSPLFATQIIATVARTALLAAEHSRVDRTFSLWNLLLTAGAALAAAPYGVLAVAWALSLSALALRAPLLIGYAVRRNALRLNDVIDGVRAWLLFAALTAGALAALLWVPASLARDVLGLCAAAGVSALALRFLRARTTR